MGAPYHCCGARPADQVFDHTANTLHRRNSAADRTNTIDFEEIAIKDSPVDGGFPARSLRADFYSRKNSLMNSALNNPFSTSNAENVRDARVYS
jgi:hypothetical protein